MTDRRAFLIVLDSVGIGGAPDAGDYFNGDVPDTGANTLGNVAEWRLCQGDALELPNLFAMGITHAAHLANGWTAPDLPALGALWAAATETSRGKDTPSGHWELAGVPVPFDWRYFPRTDPAIPPEITDEIARLAGADGTLGNGHASGMPVIRAHGAEHVATGRPIVYTSADSVLQIAAHEEAFGLARLLDLCAAIAPRMHAMRVGRVIARPFVGTGPEDFARTTNRRDYAMECPEPTLLDWAHAAGREVIGVGKIGDIFAGRGLTGSGHGADAALMDHLADLIGTAPPGALVIANLVEFDTLHGHPRDPAGYAGALERFDAWLGEALPALREGDLMCITADHGNDPTWTGTDHTRERVPVLMHGPAPRAAGHVAFADVGASVADWLGLEERGAGRSFL